MPSPRRLTSCPPRCSTGGSIASLTSRSSLSAASSPASSAHSEKSTRSVKTIVSSRSPRPRPCASDTACQTWSALRPASRIRPGRSAVRVARRRPTTCGCALPPVESESPNSLSPGRNSRKSFTTVTSRALSSTRLAAAAIFAPTRARRVVPSSCSLLTPGSLPAHGSTHTAAVPILLEMDAERLVLVRGMADTRATLDSWTRDPWPVLRRWLALSGGVACALLLSVLLGARLSTPDATPLRLPGVGSDPVIADAAAILGRNLLVLALHAMACVAGFMAGASMPQLADQRTGLSRVVHGQAGGFAILFVIGPTLFSLATQAYVLGSFTSTLSYQHDVAPAVLILGLLPHALPELTALFLPLAAWTIASHRGDWDELLAATFVTTALALPVLVGAAFVEMYVSPHLLVALMGG